MSDDRQKALEIAGDIALREMVQHLVASVCKGSDASTSRANLAAFEAKVVDGIQSRRHFPQADDATETFIKESASGYVSRIIGMINIDQ